MNPILKRELISGAITFVAAFLLSVGAALTSVGDAEITSALILGILMTAARTALKALAGQIK